MLNPTQALKELLNQTDRQMAVYQNIENKEDFWDKQIQEQKEQRHEQLHKSIKKASRERKKQKRAFYQASNTVHYTKTTQVTQNNEPIFTDGNKFYILKHNFQMQLIVS